uniref:Long wavelength sensitive opsin 1 n=1 Tax=Brassicogethes aeneus TaxID=1431903 RepID=A0A1P8SF92_BRAAE|nr:long wavelength sensitive opsin 1 [Brassicogethes aeneus]
MSVVGQPSFAAWSGAQSSGFGGNNLSVVDKVTPDMIHLVDPYWYQFPPMNPLWHALLGISIGVLGVISLIGNGMVMYIFATTKALKTPSNLLVVNLAFSDFSMMFTNSFPMVVNNYYETWIWGPLNCALYGMFGSIFGCVSIWSMAFIALDRYNVIVKGLNAKPFTKKTASLWILLIWTMAIGWSLAPLFGWNRFVPEGNLSSCGTDFVNKELFHKSFLLVYASFVYFTPLSLIIYCYFFIVQAVAVHEKSMREQAKKMNVASLRSAESQQTSAECKLAKIALMTIALWFFAWTPYLVINFCGIFESQKISPLSTIWSSLFAKANACYNPIVYGISHPKYRQALEKRFPSLVCGKSVPRDDAVSNTSGVTQVADGDKTSA